MKELSASIVRSVLLVFVLLFVSLAFGTSYHHSRSGPSYGGGHHTTSHGGHYSGGHGSCHQGGYYKNPGTANHYGYHKP